MIFALNTFFRSGSLNNFLINISGIEDQSTSYITFWNIRIEMNNWIVPKKLPSRPDFLIGIRVLHLAASSSHLIFCWLISRLPQNYVSSAIRYSISAALVSTILSGQRCFLQFPTALTAIGWQCLLDTFGYLLFSGISNVVTTIILSLFLLKNFK